MLKQVQINNFASNLKVLLANSAKKSRKISRIKILKLFKNNHLLKQLFEHISIFELQNFDISVTLQRN